MDYEGNVLMIKKSLVCLGLLLAGCTPQREYLVIAHFHNICNSPVQVIAHHYTNVHEPWETSILDVKAEIGETVLVLDTWGFNYNPEYGVAPIYKLELGSNGKQRSFDRGSFMAILKRSKHGGYGNSQKSRQKRINDYLNAASLGDDKAKHKLG